MFTVVELEREQENTLELIWGFYKEGRSNNYIRDYLNRNRIKPQRVAEYTNKMIWSAIKKYEIRLRNKSEIRTAIEDIYLLKR